MRRPAPQLAHLLEHVHTSWERKKEQRQRHCHWVAGGVSGLVICGLYIGTTHMVAGSHHRPLSHDHEMLSLLLPEPPSKDTLTAAAAAAVPLMEVKVDPILATQLVRALPAIAYALSRREVAANAHMLGGNTWVVVAAVVYSLGYVAMSMCRW